jgi:hypothetical protein
MLKMPKMKDMKRPEKYDNLIEMSLFFVQAADGLASDKTKLPKKGIVMDIFQRPIIKKK